MPSKNSQAFQRLLDSLEASGNWEVLRPPTPEQSPVLSGMTPEQQYHATNLYQGCVDAQASRNEIIGAILAYDELEVTSRTQAEFLLTQLEALHAL